MQDIFISDTGKGFPLVLIHGFLGSSKIWKPQINYFQKYYRVLVPDLPGFGKSINIKSKSNLYSIARLLLRTIKKRGIKKFYLLGHSMGGMIVQEMVKMDPYNIEKLIFYATGPIGEMPGRFETVEKSRKNFKRNGLEVTAKKIIKTWFVKKENSLYFNLCFKSGQQTTLEAVDNSLTAFKSWNNLKSLKKIKNKTLIIWGEKDKSYNLKQIKLLKNNIKNSELIIFKNCAHNVHLEEVKKFNIIVKKFIL